MKKNVAGQKIGAQLVSATDGSAFTGSVTVAVTVDAGTQATGSVGSGACVHEGGGYHTYAPAQAETNGDLIAFTFSGTGAVPVTVQVYTNNLPTAAPGASNGLLIAGANSGATSFTSGVTIINSAGAALGLASLGGNGAGLSILGNGSGAGILATAGLGSNAPGIGITGGGTSGPAMSLVANSGHGFEITGAGSAKDAIHLTPGSGGAGLSGSLLGNLTGNIRGAVLNKPVTWFVAASGGNDSNAGTYPGAPLATKEQALTNAADGDEICFLPGSHAWSSEWDTSAKQLVIKGYGWASTCTFTTTDNTKGAIKIGTGTRATNMRIVCANKGIGITSGGATFIDFGEIDNCYIQGYRAAINLVGHETYKVHHNFLGSVWDSMVCEGENIEIYNNVFYNAFASASELSEGNTPYCGINGLNGLAGYIHDNTFILGKAGSNAKHVAGVYFQCHNAGAAPFFRDNHFKVYATGGTGEANCIKQVGADSQVARVSIFGGSMDVSAPSAANARYVALNAQSIGRGYGVAGIADKTKVTGDVLFDDAAGMAEAIETIEDNLDAKVSEVSAQASGGPIEQRRVAPNRLLTVKSRSDGTFGVIGRVRMLPGETSLWGLEFAGSQIAAGSNLWGMEEPTPDGEEAENIEVTGYGISGTQAKFELELDSNASPEDDIEIDCEVRVSATETIIVTVPVTVGG